MLWKEQKKAQVLAATCVGDLHGAPHSWGGPGLALARPWLLHSWRGVDQLTGDLAVLLCNSAFQKLKKSLKSEIGSQDSNWHCGHM